MGIELILKLEAKEVALEILNSGRPIDAEKFSYYHDLDEKLITHVDNLLKRNNIDISSIKSYKIVENLGENATSVRIAEAVIEALKLKI